MLHYLRRLLNATYDVTAVGDGVAALAKAKEQQFDLVLTDIMMPRLDGVGLLNALRADQRTRSIPVIFLSARAGEESRIEGLSAGADDYLVKPFSAHELLARVVSNLKLSQLRRSTDESVAKRNARLSLLWEAAGVLLTTNDPDAMLSSLFEKIRTMLDLDVYFNFMVNESGDALRLVSYGGVPAETATAISRLEFGTAVCGRVALRKEPIIATRIQDSEDPMVQLVKGFGVRAYACNPLLAGGKLLGTVSFASRRRDSFEQEEIEFLETISKYITAAYERLQLIEQLRDQDRRKDEFLATLAHELRNPLAPMHNGLQLIRLATSNPATLEQARTMMERQLKQMKRLVDDLLDVSRISRNKLDLRMELTELASIVGSAIETSQPLLEAADQRLRVSLPIEPVVLNADPVRLAQAFSNLLNNAAKYSGQGSEIWFEVEQEAGEAIVRVRDNGIGIPVDQLKSVFDIFVQVDRSLERSQGGLGVGLTLVKQLVQMHGGRVEVRSEGPGKGNEFIVRLPVVMRQQTKAPAPAQVTAPLDTNGGQRILVVDDNVDSAESLSLMLELLGHKVSLAHDGLEAVEAAKQFKPDIAFLDLGMPKMNGYDAARLIREQPENRGVKLVALTGWGQEEDKRRSHDAGFDMHLVKPIDFSALEKLLEQ
jgi:signal transduction histidine kinase/DNA-binding response OmpR family regulator